MQLVSHCYTAVLYEPLCKLYIYKTSSVYLCDDSVTFGFFCFFCLFFLFFFLLLLLFLLFFFCFFFFWQGTGIEKTRLLGLYPVGTKR